MRKIISGITGLMCMMLVTFGFITCMCETADFRKQLTTMLMGITIIAIGTVFGFISKEVAEW